MRTSDAINEIAAALAKAQGAFHSIPKNKTGKVSGTTKAGKFFEYEYKYAALPDVLDGIKEALSSNDLTYVQPTVIADGNLIVLTRIMHSSGQWIESEYPVCAISAEHQKMGAAMTYARRYALTSLVGVAADEDVDGVGAASADDGKRKRSSYAVKKEDGERWPAFERDIRASTTVEELDAAWKKYSQEMETWPKTWQDKADEEFMSQLDVIGQSKEAAE